MHILTVAGQSRPTNRARAPSQGAPPMPGLKGALRRSKPAREARTEPLAAASHKRRCGWHPELLSRALLCFWTFAFIGVTGGALWVLREKIIPGTVENGLMTKTRCTVLNATLWPAAVRCAYPECPFDVKLLDPDRCKSAGRCLKLRVGFELADGTPVVHTRPVPTLGVRDEYVAAYGMDNFRPYKSFASSAYVPADGAAAVPIEGGRVIDLVAPPGLEGGCSAVTCRADPAAATLEAEVLLSYWPVGYSMDCLYMTAGAATVDLVESGNEAPPVVLKQDVPGLDLIIYVGATFFAFVPVAWACLRRIGRHNRYGQIQLAEARSGRRASTTTHAESTFAKV